MDDPRLVPGLARRPRSRSETCTTASYPETYIAVGYPIGEADSNSKVLQNTTGSQSESSMKAQVPGDVLHGQAVEEDRKTKDEKKQTDASLKVRTKNPGASKKDSTSVLARTKHNSRTD